MACMSVCCSSVFSHQSSPSQGVATARKHAVAAAHAAQLQPALPRLTRGISSWCAPLSLTLPPPPPPSPVPLVYCIRVLAGVHPVVVRLAAAGEGDVEVGGGAVGLLHADVMWQQAVDLVGQAVQLQLLVCEELGHLQGVGAGG